MRISRLLTIMATLALLGGARAQDAGSLTPKALPPLAHPEDPNNAAKEVFGRKTTPAALPPQVVGFYAKGCLAGAQAVPVDGEAWQVMRLSRNRNWGHPALVGLIERLARQARAAGTWSGFLVGDMSQPRGGPMITGHASHQVGLDADVWLTPMPGRTLTRLEREETSAINVVRPDRLDIDPQIWTPNHMGVIRTVAQAPEVERIFVNPAIKKAICRDATGDRRWLSKVRPMYGHDYHFHIRIACPAGEASCVHQPPPPAGDGCDDSLAWWFTDAVLHPKPRPNVKPPKPMMVAQLPAQCRAVLNAK
jgi:penicillin-insensitive murein endopeptidase